MNNNEDIKYINDSGLDKVLTLLKQEFDKKEDTVESITTAEINALFEESQG